MKRGESAGDNRIIVERMLQKINKNVDIVVDVCYDANTEQPIAQKKAHKR